MRIDPPAAAVHMELPFPPRELPGVDPAPCWGCGGGTSDTNRAGRIQEVPRGSGSLPVARMGCPAMHPVLPPWAAASPAVSFPRGIRFPSRKDQPDLVPGYAKRAALGWGAPGRNG